jgi:hypothetical protein
MAYADYRLCDRCREKTFYDSNLNYELEDPEAGRWGLWGLGDWSVLCTKCAEEFETVIVPKNQSDLRAQLAALRAEKAEVVEELTENGWGTLGPDPNRLVRVYTNASLAFLPNVVASPRLARWLSEAQTEEKS